MKIYTFIEENLPIDKLFGGKIYGGQHMSVLHQIKALQDLGHEVRVCIIRGSVKDDIVDNFENDTDTNVESLNSSNGKLLYRKYKKILPKYINEKVDHFNPDLIICQDWKNWKYNSLSNKYPILVITHCQPLYLWDLRRAAEYEVLQSKGHKISCVSEYAKEMCIKFHTKDRRQTVPHIVPDYVLYPSYCEKNKGDIPSNKLTHTSRVCTGKKTFLICDYLNECDIKPSVFTQSIVQPYNETNEKYLNTNLTKYQSYVNLDIKHSKIMKELKTSTASYVGMANYDTFTITSLESLSKGVPLLVTSRNNLPHPATEMVGDDCKKYVYEFKSKDDFIQKVKEFSKMSLDERQKLADSCYKKMGWENFKKVWNNAALQTVKSFENKNSTLKRFM